MDNFQYFDIDLTIPNFEKKKKEEQMIRSKNLKRLESNFFELLLDYFYNKL